jgi:hypothetical protein
MNPQNEYLSMKSIFLLMFIASKLTAKILYKILFSITDNIYITNAKIEICYISVELSRRILLNCSVF